MEAAVLPNAARQNTTELRRAARRAVARLDPNGAHARHAARKQDRRVELFPMDDVEGASLTTFGPTAAQGAGLAGARIHCGARVHCSASGSRLDPPLIGDLGVLSRPTPGAPRSVRTLRPNGDPLNTEEACPGPARLLAS